ncbi:BlaI/MecI/CopY family transcriptional regulator [Flexivirga meconopsidis]|uniref:BlaI/MecI/CopY family transcriptional regulator n=1 Tax=Flexivirga meconopsidis TaxID=2977121 RepID=UPI002240605C
MKRRPVPSLGELESAVMDQLWQLPDDGSLSVREVQERLAGRDLAYTTVMTVLDRLAKKQLVDRERVGRAWHYRPVASREQLTADTLHAGLESLTPDDRRAVLLHFLEDASAEDRDALRAGLEEVERRNRT